MSTPMLDKLRAAMKDAGVDAYIIFNTDPNNDEYIPEDFMVIKALTGFTGDNAIAVVTSDFAGVWTDSRFFISGELELRGSGFQLMKKQSNNDPSFMSFVAGKLPKGSLAAFDGNLITQSDYQMLCRKLQPAGIAVRNDVDLTSMFWTSRPAGRITDIFVLGDSYAGKSAAVKLQELRSQLTATESDHLVLTRLDDIAWLLNLRAADIDYCPVFRAYMVVHRDASIRDVLFLHDGRLSAYCAQYIESLHIELRPYDDVCTYLSCLLAGHTVQIDCTAANSRIVSSVNPDCRLQDRKSPVQFAKAVKNATEIANIRKAMLLDGAAMERFLCRMEGMAANGYQDTTELSLASMLYGERAKGETFISESFECISAFNGHAAMPHYAPNPGSDLAIRPDGVYLVDSGAQYLYGTTDITRTLPTGKFSSQFARDYTLVLMGHIELAMAVFPEGTTGVQLDTMARMHMWRHGRGFGHGTGHGVGYCLNCHEGPQGISPRAGNVSLKAGMVITDEPGIYIENEYGIRTENMLLVVESEFSGYLRFEPLTLCHIDTRPVIRELMTPAQIEYLNDYNARVRRELEPYLSADELAYIDAVAKAV